MRLHVCPFPAVSAALSYHVHREKVSWDGLNHIGQWDRNDDKGEVAEITFQSDDFLEPAETGT